MVKLSPMTEEQFRVYQEDDIQRLAEEYVKAGVWTDAEALENSRKEHQRLLPDGIKTRNHNFFTVTDENSGRKVGLIWMEVNQDVSIPYAFIYDFFINEDQRRKGYGAGTLQAAEKWLKSMGIRHVSLHVYAHNKIAQELYDKSGFEVTGIFMRKKLVGHS